MLHFISVKISLVVDVKNHQGNDASNRRTKESRSKGNHRNHKIMEGVGLKRTLKSIFHQPRLLQIPSNLALNVCRDENSTSSISTPAGVLS